MNRWFVLFLSLAVATLFVGVDAASADPPSKPAATAPASIVRVAAIGGVNDQGFWKAVSQRFEQKTGIHVETVTTGNKDAVADLFKRGGIDLITVQSADAIMGLVADGYARDPQPWVKTELIIVGPQADPAGIKGTADAGAAVGKILASKSPFVIHASLGADEVVRGIVQAGKGQLADGQAMVLLDDHQKRVLQAASDRHAYTLIGGIAFRSGKIPAGGLIELVKGDPILRRPFVLAIANPQRFTDAHIFEASRLAEFLRSNDTQRWIAGWRQGQPGDVQEFFPVEPAIDLQLPAGVILRVTGSIDQRLDLTPALWAKLPRTTVKLPDKDGAEVAYTGVLLREVLRAVNVPLGDHRLRGPWVNRTVHVHAADGYQSAFALAEFDGDLAERNIVIADQKDAHELPTGEGPLRLIVPGETRPARWAKQVIVVEVR
jgi:tungstate transport system substrate-binding protein